MKKLRKAVRTFLIADGKIVVIKYKTKINKDYYDIPGGKIEENETSFQTSIREFKEETRIDIISQKYIGKAIIEYPNKIFDIDLYIAKEYEGTLQNSEENDSLWIDIQELLKKDKKLPSIEIIKYLDIEDINLKIYSDDDHNVLKTKL